MDFSNQGINRWLRKHKWPVALVAVVIFGYTFGKDMALTHNAADQLIEQGEAS